jgi:hypothetical protein
MAGRDGAIRNDCILDVDRCLVAVFRKKERKFSFFVSQTRAMLTRMLSITPTTPITPLNARVVARPRQRAHSNRVVVDAVPSTSVDDTGSPAAVVRIESRRVVLATAIVLAGTAGKALAAGKVVAGKSAKELARSAKARREKLKETAAKMREKGKAESAFEESKFALGEDATTPNRVNRTGEGGSGI